MAYNAKLNSYVNKVRQEITDAVDNDRIGEWVGDNVLDIRYKDGGAVILLSYGGPTIILDTSTGDLWGMFEDSKCLEHIGDDYAYDINNFLESQVY